jgi:hypothetical protein
MAKRPYSTKYTAQRNPRRYLLSGIPPTLWDRARAKARRDGVAMRSLILTLLEEWMAADVATDDRSSS